MKKDEKSNSDRHVRIISFIDFLTEIYSFYLTSTGKDLIEF